MKLSKALELFLTSVRASGLSVRTFDWYSEHLARLVSFLGDRDLTKITTDDLRAFLVSQRDRSVKYEHHKHRKPVNSPLSAYTLHAYARAIKRLFNWLEQEGRISQAQNVALRLQKPKLPKPVPKGMADSDLRALLKAARSAGVHSKRHYATLLFLADTGCRVEGIVGLRVSDLDLTGGSATVTEKGRKGRTVFFGEATRKALEDWLSERPAGSEFVFPGRFGQWTKHGVYQLMRRLKQEAGVTGRVNPHSLRHRFAKSYLTNGGDLGTLADQLGHSDVKVTKDSYSVFLTEELKRKHEQHSPLVGILDD